MATEKLKFFPITFFASVMGLVGYTIALDRINEVFELGLQAIVGILLYLTTAWFFIVLFFYLLKFFKYPEEVKKDINHPIKIHFLPTLSISIILLSIAFQKMSPNLSYLFWIFGSVLHLFFLFYIINKWFFHEFKLNFKNPSWFIPIVGPILVPLSGVSFSTEISWFFFSIGIILWLPFLAILFYRLIFTDPMPLKLLPTLTILIAPPSVGFISYVKLIGNLDNFGRILFYFGVFTFLMVLTFVRKFIKLPFFMSWWAYTFPLAAFTISIVLYYKMSNIGFFGNFALFSIIVTTIVILIVLVKTIISAMKGEICIEE